MLLELYLILVIVNAELKFVIEIFRHGARTSIHLE